MYNKICEYTMGMNLNEIHIKYKAKEEENKIRRFGSNFIKNNYNNCNIVLNGLKYKLITYLDIKKEIYIKR